MSPHSPLQSVDAFGIASKLDKYLMEQSPKIEEWFRTQSYQAPFYCSIDTRHSGHKLSAIDINLFPAGFNNLSKQDHITCSEHIKKYLNDQYPSAQSILIIAENHTRNVTYFHNLKTLQTLIRQAGFTCQIGAIGLNARFSTEGADIDVIDHHNQALWVGNTRPDIIILNNDLSSGLPEILTELSQPCLPLPTLGWHSRRKTDHFRHYNDFAHQLGETIALDPFLLCALFRECNNVEFMSLTGLDCVKQRCHELLEAIQIKYNEHNILAQPYVVIKSNHGTYGFANFIIDRVESLDTLNRKQRTRLSSGKGGNKTSSVIIQEGITTNLSMPPNIPAEATLYTIGAAVTGGFMRYHPHKTATESLNASGMEFQPLIFNALSHEHLPLAFSHIVCSRLAILTTAKEMELIDT